MNTEMMVANTTPNALDKIADPIAAAEKLGQWLYQSALFGATSESAGKVLALTCILERKTPVEIARTYHIVLGKLSMRTDAMLAEFMKRGGSVEWLEFSNEKCSAKFTMGKNSIIMTKTKQDALNSRWGSDDGKEFKKDSAWAKTPDAMLRARVISFAIRMICPEIIAGCYSSEEVADMREIPATVVNTEPLLPEDIPSEQPPDRDLAREKIAFFSRLKSERGLTGDEARLAIKTQCQVTLGKDTCDTIDELDRVVDVIFPVGGDNNQ